MASNEIPNTKLEIYTALIRPISSYRTEAWTMSSEEINALKSPLKADCKKNVWSHKARIKVENKNK